MMEGHRSSLPSRSCSHGLEPRRVVHLGKHDSVDNKDIHRGLLEHTGTTALEHAADLAAATGARQSVLAKQHPAAVVACAASSSA
jgi:hypothetical protein